VLARLVSVKCSMGVFPEAMRWCFAIQCDENANNQGHLRRQPLDYLRVDLRKDLGLRGIRLAENEVCFLRRTSRLQTVLQIPIHEEKSLMVRDMSGLEPTSDMC